MWLLGKATIEAWEFYSTHVTTPRSHVTPGHTAKGKFRKGIKALHQLNVGPYKFIGALARSGATLSSNAGLGFWRAMGATGRFQEACENVGTELRATPGLLGHLRDSSRTALAGELGQAVTWLLAIDHFKSNAVVDFGRGCTLIGPPPVPAPGASDTRPDFMASAAPWSSVSLFESKGTITDLIDDSAWGSGIKHGLTQTMAGESWLSSNGYPGIVSKQLSVSFALAEQDPSKVVFADPEGLVQQPLSRATQIALLRAHFGSWAAAGGQLALADAMYSGVTKSDLRGLIDRLPTILFRDRYMKLALPDAGLRDFWCIYPMLHAADEPTLNALAEEDLEGINSSVDNFRHAVMGWESTLEPRESEPVTGETPLSAAFADGTALVSHDDFKLYKMGQ